MTRRDPLVAQIILGGFSLLGAYFCFQILNSSAEGTWGGWKVGGGIAGFLATYYATNKFYRQSLVQSKDTMIDVIKELPSRPGYIDAMIESVEKAQVSIWLCVHTLNPSRTHKNIRMLQEKLAQAITTGKDVKILAPGGVERVEAAYELSMIKRIPIKILTYLEDEDFRFTIVDNNVVIISTKKQGADNASGIGVVIRSERLNELVRNYFDELWNRSEAMEYDTFLSEIVLELKDPRHPISNEKIAQRLQIPLSEINRIHA